MNGVNGTPLPAPKPQIGDAELISLFILNAAEQRYSPANASGRRAGVAGDPAGAATALTYFLLLIEMPAAQSRSRP
jgi:hypothetical protein